MRLELRVWALVILGLLAGCHSSGKDQEPGASGLVFGRVFIEENGKRIEPGVVRGFAQVCLYRQDSNVRLKANVAKDGLFVTEARAGRYDRIEFYCQMWPHKIDQAMRCSIELKPGEAAYIGDARIILSTEGESITVNIDEFDGAAQQLRRRRKDSPPSVINAVPVIRVQR